VHNDPDDDRVLASFMAPPPGVPVRVRTGVPSEPTHSVLVHLGVPAAERDAASDIEIWAVRRSDGNSLLFGSDDDGRSRLNLPVGRWELQIGGEVGPFRHVARTINVDGAARETVRIALQMWPAVPVSGIDFRYRSDVVVSSAHEQRSISAEELENGWIRIPRDRDISLRVRSTGFDSAGYPGCLVRIAKSMELTGPVRLAPPPDWAGDAMIGSPALTAGAVSILDSDGRPVKDASVRTSYRNFVEEWYTDESGQVASGPEGARVTVRANRASGYWATLRTRLTGKRPWTVRFGSASVRIEVRDPAGSRIKWSGVLPDGESFWECDQDVELYGLQPGLHRVLVCADGFHGVVRQFRLRPDDLRVLAVVLTRK